MRGGGVGVGEVVVVAAEGEGGGQIRVGTLEHFHQQAPLNAHSSCTTVGKMDNILKQ